MTQFNPVEKKASLASLEGAVLDFWRENDIFQKSVDGRKGSPEFVFYDGPPFATGLPHYGHLLAGTIKDIIPRYQTMRGFRVDRRFGWDCHGLPVEYEVEQDLKLNGKREIETLGVGVFNEHCRSIVLRYSKEWRSVVTRMGRWVDFDNDYKTMDPTYMESIWWVFKTLMEKGLIYEGNKVLWYCPRCSTPLSNFETNQGYEDVQDPAITVRFRVEGRENVYLLAWTTTPWTLPSNMALAVGKDLEYVEVRDGDETFILAKDRLSTYYRDEGTHRVVNCITGERLLGLRYTPIFPYFAGKKAEGAFRVVAGDFVSTQEGTGIVHIAPGFGEDDHRLGLAEGIPLVCPVDEEGRFTAEITEYAGTPVKEADKAIIAQLKRDRILVHHSTILHPYPHCWRCDTALISKAVSTWFVRVERIRDSILKSNSQTSWTPSHLRDGRFGKWLENARDWAISRNRYWGTPLPIWKSADGKEIVCVGSMEELTRLSGQPVADLHKHFVDPIEIPSREGRGMLRRIPEVLDCWFESGAMPYAQAHYPFENRKHFEQHFPADFIAEGLDQTRGWFYTLMVISSALFDRPAFRNVVVNGLVLAEDGRKMSKRLKNYADPIHIIETYGADALRLYLVNSPVVKAEDLRFSEEGVKDLMRQILIPWWNAYSFFVTYARVDGWQPTPDAALNSPNLLDRWIVSSLESLTATVVAAMNEYDLQRAVRPFVVFIEDLTNWYIRRSRRRFWKSSDDEDKAAAYATLHYVLIQLSKIAAPFVPFISESIYRNLRTQDMPESVHLCDYPVPNQSLQDQELEQQMSDALRVVRLGRLLRTDYDLKVRQPLSKLRIVSRNTAMLERLRAMTGLIADELNVKNVDFGSDESALAMLKAKADFRRLGPRLGKNMKQVASSIGALESVQVEQLLNGKPLKIQAGDTAFEIGAEDVIVERTPHAGLVVRSESDVVVALETELTEALIQEGLAREFVNKVQNMRKTCDFDVTQRIRVRVGCHSDLRQALQKHAEDVNAEILCVECSFHDEPLPEAQEWDINGYSCRIQLIPQG